jgi:hypothetical protein
MYHNSTVWLSYPIWNVVSHLLGFWTIQFNIAE